MAGNKGKSKTAKPLTVEAKRDESASAALARFALRPSLKGAVTVEAFTKGYGEIELADLMSELCAQANAANDGDLKRAEGMLMIQAHTLDAIFNNLAQRAARAEYMSQLEPYMRLALKAQSQCRATLESLAAIKNPQPVAFVKQANIAHNQQVNNAPAEPTPARENEIQPNELLTVNHGETLDSFRTCTASGIDPAMATVETIDRTENGKR